MSNITFQRSFEFNRDGIDEEKRTVELSFSSTEEYERWFGIEILSHKAGAVDLSRLNQSSPLLLDHDARQQIGVIEKAWIEGEKGRALVRFSKSQRADEVFQDVLDGIRKNVSVGYQVHEMKLVGTRDNGLDVYEVTKWTPFEISIVSVPADVTVGVGRSAEEEFIKKIKNPEVRIMETRTEVDVTQIQAEARKEELARIREITAIGERLGMVEDARKFIDEGKSIDEFRKYALEKMPEPKPFSNVKRVDEDAEIGLTEKEKREFSFLRLINALANPTDRKAQERARFEFECSDAVAKQLRKSPNGAFVPYEVLKRDLTVGGTGSNVVDTTLDTASFIEMLRNKLIIKAAGAQILGGLVGDLAIPRQSGGATAYWVAESGAPNESDVALEQIGLTPKTVGAFSDISRKMLKQSSIDVEAFLRRDLASTLALAIDYAAIAGDGASNNPKGILNTTGIGLVVGGTDGAAVDWSHIVNLESEVAIDNADIGTLAYLTNAKVRGRLKQTEKASGTGLWIWENGEYPLNGYRTFVSNQVPSNLDKGTSTGVCSAIIFGNFSDLIIGEWGTLDITVDPYSQSTTGTVRVVVFQDVDIAVRHPESFAVMKDALTS